MFVSLHSVFEGQNDSLEALKCVFEVQNRVLGLLQRSKGGH